MTNVVLMFASRAPASAIFWPSIMLLLTQLLLISAPLEAWISPQNPPTRPKMSLLALPSETSSPSTQSTPASPKRPNCYTMEVSYDGRTVEAEIQKGEPILTALERTGAADALCVPSLPSDCRRGNCLTCVGRHVNGSNASNLVRGEDGLSPHMSKQTQKRGYILTCSSFIAGEGVKLELGKHNNAWDELYRQRLEEEETQLAGREAMAKTIRFSHERNPQEFVRETEKIWEKTE